MRATRIVAASLLLLAVAVGCGKTVYIVQQQAPQAPPPPFQRIVVASLPLENITPDIDAPQMLRQQLYGRLGAKGYLVQPVADTDDKLRGMGITLGGQLGAVNTAEFHQKLGVDAILAGKVTVASSIVTGIYNRRELQADLTLTDVRTGSVIWSYHDRVTGEDSTQAKTGLGLALGAVRGVERSNLSREAQTFANVAVNHMPRCPREGEPAWNGLAIPPSGAPAAPAPAAATPPPAQH